MFGVATAVQADIPDAGVIHGCYGKPGTPQTGELRVIDASRGEQCRYYENPLTWNQGGPTGPTGKRGPTGPTGPSTLVTNYTFSQSFGPVVLTDVATLILPTGSYSLSGTIDSVGPSVATTYDEINCDLAKSGGTATLHHGTTSTVLHDITDFATVPIAGDITVTSGPTTVHITCSAGEPSEAEEVTFFATLVGNITAQ
jgi:hypothetical protein